MSHTYLFELGTEEIPAEMIAPAVARLRDGLVEQLAAGGCAAESVQSWSTPRRLVVQLQGLPAREPDRRERLQGPPRSVAFDQDGEPTDAARGFAARQGVEVADLQVVETERGDYLMLERTAEGRPLTDILPAAIPEIVSSIEWPKSMYWNASRFRFIRPLRWFVSLWDDEVVPFEMQGVTAGRLSRGHRSLGSGTVEIAAASDYLEALEQNRVIVDPAERRRRIEAGLEAAVPEGLAIKPDEALLDIVVQLNEFPSVVRGDFDSRYLEIPSEVLVTVMRHHQKYFSLLDGDGALAPHFLTVTNSDGDPEGEIRRGHEKVLKARLEDAEFFWNSDCGRPLAERVDDLAGVLFQEALGTYLDKTRRLERLVAHLDDDRLLVEAATLAKADLTTDMVRELPELQGIMGGLYARRDGSDAWEAVYAHYQPVGADDPVPANRLAALLSAADRLDTVAGCFSAGIVPTGSRDPFALRRQAQGLVRILIEHDLPWSLDQLLEWAGEPFEFDAETLGRLRDFLNSRLEHALAGRDVASDVVRAVMAAPAGALPDLVARAEAVAAMKGHEDFQALAAAFKRIRNLLAKSASAETDLGEVSDRLLSEPAEQRLYNESVELQPRLDEMLQTRRYQAALSAMAALRPAVDGFFDDVMVMVDEADVRRNRLALLQHLSELFGRVADISEIHQGRSN